jgi:hypothetical protein
VDIMKRMCRLSIVVGILAAAATGLATSGDRVSEICVIAAEIDYCAPGTEPG